MTLRSGSRLPLAILAGILLSSAGMFLGFDLGSGTAELLGGEPGIWARLAKGLVWGGLIAGLQWFVARASGVRPAPFVTACAACFAAGYPLGQTVQMMFAFRGYTSDMIGYWLAVATFGLSLGLPQWWLLRRRIRLPGLLIASGVIGWLVTGLVWLTPGPPGVFDALAFGLVTGSSLVLLVRAAGSSRTTRESCARSPAPLR